VREGHEDKRAELRALKRAQARAHGGVKAGVVIGRCKGCGALLVRDEAGLGLCYSCLWHILGPGYCPDCDANE
jgi:hypothetical protein